MSEVKVDIPRCGNCGARIRPDLESCEYCGVRFVREGSAAPLGASPAVPVAVQQPAVAPPAPPAPPAQPTAAQPVAPPAAPVASYAQAPVAAAAPVASYAPTPVAAPSVSAAPVAPAGGFGQGPHAPHHHVHEAGPSPFAKFIAVLEQVTAEPSVQPHWKHGCHAWQRWCNEEHLSKHDEAASNQVEAIFLCAYLIQWNADTFSPRQWKEFAGALAAASLGHLTAADIEPSIEEWDEDLEAEDDESWEAELEWIVEVLPEAGLRRAAYQFCVASAAIDGQRSDDDAEVLDELAEVLEIPAQEALALQRHIAQRMA